MLRPEPRIDELLDGGEPLGASRQTVRLVNYQPCRRHRFALGHLVHAAQNLGGFGVFHITIDRGAVVTVPDHPRAGTLHECPLLTAFALHVCLSKPK